MKLSINVVMIIMLFSHIAVPAYASKNDPDTLVIGKISHNPKKHYAYLKPMVKYVVKQMADLGVTKAKVRMARNKHQLAKWMKAGTVDWVTETAYASGFLIAKGNAEPLLLKEKKGKEQYHSIIFVRKDSGINRLSDLLGKTIAFEDLASTSSFYEPALMLLHEGITLKNLSSTQPLKDQDVLSVRFAGEEITIATWVEKNIVQAGAVNNYDWTKEDHVPSSYRQQFKILARSKSLPRAIETVRSDLPRQIKERLKKVLLAASETNSGQSVMWAYQRTTGFQNLTQKQIEFLNNSHQLGLDVSRLRFQ